MPSACEGYKIVEKGVRDMDFRNWSPLLESGGIQPWKIFKLEILENGISRILRLSQRFVMSRCL